MKYLSVLLIAFTISACAGNKAPVLVAQTGLAVTQAIGQLQTTTKQLTDTNVLTPAQALPVQEALLAINTKLAPLPEIVRSIDRLQIAGQSTQTNVDKAIAILQEVGQDISTVVAGVPATATTKQLIDLVRAAQATVQSTMLAIAKLKGGQ